MEPINGKTYPMWQGLIEKKSELIGGTLVEYDGDIGATASTKIIDIKLSPNGNSAMIEIVGEKFTASCDVGYCGITGGSGLWIKTRFRTEWNLKKPNEQ